MKEKVILFLLVIILAHWASAQEKLNDKGFDLSNLTLSKEFIKDGGPPRDGIPSIDQPEFLSIKEANHMLDEDRILGVRFNGIAKAFPVKILNFHEIVNDQFGDHPVVVTFCPLCGSGLAFDALINDSRKTFGVSGLLYNSDVLLYDRQTETLWSQIISKGVSGPLVGHELTVLQTYNTSWKEWKSQEPNTLVLSTNTGFDRDHSRDPYPDYYESEKVWFPVAITNDAMHAKTKVIGLKINGTYIAYPFPEMKKAKKPIHDLVDGKEILIHFNKKEESAYITDTKGTVIPSTTLFWFAWVAFHPETEIYSAKKNN